MMAEVSRCITLHNISKVGGEMASIGGQSKIKIDALAGHVLLIAIVGRMQSLAGHSRLEGRDSLETAEASSGISKTRRYVTADGIKSIDQYNCHHLLIKAVSTLQPV
jgi:hypothetical protein